MEQLYSCVHTGTLRLDDTSIKSFAFETGTPLYVYDANTIAARCRLLKSIADPHLTILYSIKANPHQGICKFISTQGLDFEIASTGELDIALRCRKDLDNCMVAGPAKCISDLTRYMEAGIGYINCESIAEAARINEVATMLGRKQKINLRINPLETSNGSKIKMGGRSSPFGIDEEVAGEAVMEIVNYDMVTLSGIHVYSGTQVLNHETILRNFEYTCQLALGIAQLTGRPLEAINFGGGLGVPFAENDQPLDGEALVENLSSLFGSMRMNPGFRNTKFFIESGRYIVGEAGYFVCSIVDIKESRGKKFIVLDGGINHYMSLSPLFRFEARNPAMHLVKCEVPFSGNDEPELYEIAGPLCTSLDCLARKVSLVNPAIDDLLVFPNAGAYALTMSPTGFLSHPHPQEILINQ